jgi:hypothetical protein
VTAKSPGWHDLQPIIYVVAEADSAKTIRIVGTEVQINVKKIIELP